METGGGCTGETKLPVSLAWGTCLSPNHDRGGLLWEVVSLCLEINSQIFAVRCWLRRMLYDSLHVQTRMAYG